MCPVLQQTREGSIHRNGRGNSDRLIELRDVYQLPLCITQRIHPLECTTRNTTNSRFVTQKVVRNRWIRLKKGSQRQFSDTAVFGIASPPVVKKFVFTHRSRGLALLCLLQGTALGIAIWLQPILFPFHRRHLKVQVHLGRPSERASEREESEQSLRKRSTMLQHANIILILSS